MPTTENGLTTRYDHFGGIPCPSGQAGIWQIKKVPHVRGALKLNI